MNPCANSNICLLVVENQEYPTQKNKLEALQLPFPLIYCHEPRAGLVYARNRGLKEADKIGAEWLASFDDDQEADINWLRVFEQAVEISPKVRIYAGPCQFRYPEYYSRFLRKLPPYHPQPGRSVVQCAGTGNAFFHHTIFGTGFENQRFDSKFNFSGGEDTDFFEKLYIKGFETHWLPNAVVYEDKNGERATLGYAMKIHRRRQANSCRIRHTNIAKPKAILTDLLKINRSIVFGFGALFSGLFLVLFKHSAALPLIGDAALRYARLQGFLDFYRGFSPEYY